MLWKRKNTSNYFFNFSIDQSVIEQGAAGDCLFVVETGQLNCLKRFVKLTFNFFRIRMKNKSYLKFMDLETPSESSPYFTTPLELPQLLPNPTASFGPLTERPSIILSRTQLKRRETNMKNF